MPKDGEVALSVQALLGLSRSFFWGSWRPSGRSPDRGLDHLLYALVGDGVQDVLYQRPVGVDDRDALAGADVGHHDIGQQRGFPHAGLAADVDGLAPVLPLDAEALPAMPPEGLA